LVQHLAAFYVFHYLVDFSTQRIVENLNTPHHILVVKLASHLKFSEVCLLLFLIIFA
jgi:hypothetical protein